MSLSLCYRPRTSCFARRSVTAAVAVLALALSQTVLARVYYVSPNGNNKAAGTSSSTAWRNISHAFGKNSPIRGGDQVIILGGTYVENVDIKQSGAPSLPIIIKGQGNVVIKDPSPRSGTGQGVLNILNARHIVVENIAVQNSYFYGVLIRGSHDVVLRNVRTYLTGASGIIATVDKRTRTRSSQIKILNSSVDKACYIFNKTGQGGQEAISIVSVDGFEVAYTQVIGGGKEGIDAKVWSRNGTIHHNTVFGQKRAGIYIDGLGGFARDISVYNNLVYKNGHGIVVSNEGGGGRTENIRVFNNVVYQNVGRGIHVANWGRGPNHPIDKVQIINNTVTKNGALGLGVENREASNIVVRNNIVFENAPRIQIEFKAGKNIVADHNMTSNPRFRNSAYNDFSLSLDSPAINAGAHAGAPDRDFNSRGRPQGGTPDIGAYEVR